MLELIIIAISLAAPHAPVNAEVMSAPVPVNWQDRQFRAPDIELPDLRPPQPSPNIRYAIQRWSFDRIDIEVWKNRAELFGLGLPFEMSGELNGELRVAVPSNAVWRRNDYRVSGTIQSPELVLEDVRLLDFVAQVEFVRGSLYLTTLQFQVAKGDGQPAGTVIGSAMLPLSESDQLFGRLAIVSMELAVLESQLPASFPLSSGRLNGKVDVQGSSRALFDLNRWRAVGSVTVDAQTRGQSESIDASGQFWLDEGRLQAADFEASLGDSSFTGNATLSLEEPYPFSCELKGQIEDWQAIADIAGQPGTIALDGMLIVDGELRGTLAPRKYALQATMRSQMLNWRRLTVEACGAGLHMDETGIRVNRLTATLAGGTVQGQLVLPWSTTEPATTPAELELTLAEVDLGKLTRTLSDSRLIVNGRAEGQLQINAPPDKVNDPEHWSVGGILELVGLGFPGQELRRCTVELAQTDGQLELTGAGQCFGGDIQLNASYSHRVPGSITGQFDLTSLAIGELIASTRLLELAEDVDGAVTMNGEFAFSDWAFDHLTADLSLREIMRRGQRVSDRVDASVAADSDRVLLDDIAGTVWGGQLAGGLTWDTENVGRRRLEFSLKGMDVAQAAVGIFPDLDRELTGQADLIGNAHFTRSVNVAGRIGLSRAELDDIPVRSLRAQFRGTIDPTRGHLKLQCRALRAELNRGRISGDMTIRRQPKWEVDGRFRLRRIKLGDDVPIRGMSSRQTGVVDGVVRIAGRRVESVGDVDATFDLSLGNARAGELPLFRDVQPFVLNIHRATVFDTGSCVGRVTRGSVILERLLLQNQQLQVLTTGTISPQGRLRLQLTAQTGNERQSIALVLLKQLPKAAPPPVAVLLTVNDFLANRTVHLELNGSLKHPVVRPRPLPILSDEAVRYLLRFAAGQ